MKLSDWSIIYSIADWITNFHFENPPQEILFQACLMLPLDQGSTDGKVGPRGPRDPDRTRTSVILEKADQGGPRIKKIFIKRTGADRRPVT